MQTAAWPEITAMMMTGVLQASFKTGGLGRLTVEGVYEVWGCWKEHLCLTDPNRCTYDWMCFQYHEQRQEWTPWGRNSEIELFPNPMCPNTV